MVLLPMAAQPKEYELYCSLGNVSTGGPFFEDECVRLDFEWSPIRYKFLKVTVRNKTSERITIEWENARISDGNISFYTDNAFTYGNPKPEEVVHAGSVATKQIAEREYFTESTPLFFDSSIKSHGRSVCELILPVRFPSGEIKDYKMCVCLKYKK